MSESIVIEVYENNCMTMQGWKADAKNPWTLKTLERCNCPDEFALPSGDWSWASNWRIDKKPGVTDEDGWEYASRSTRFRNNDRGAKPVCSWGDRARRRKWSRIMRRDAGIGKSADLNRVLPKIQIGLKSILSARQRIEEITRDSPEAAQSEVMQQLIQSVQKNIADINSALDQVDKSPGVSVHQAATVKKLKNDVAKEEIAIQRALFPITGATKSGFIPLRKQGSGGFGGSSLSSSNDRSGSGQTTRGSLYSPISGPVAPVPSSSSRGPTGSRNGATATVGDGAATMGVNSRVAVKGGSKGDFNPSVMASRGGGGSTGIEAEDGVFIDRNAQEDRIFQKFKPIEGGEAGVMQAIIDERSVEISKVHKGIVEINEMFADLSRIVKEQQVEIDTIFDNVDESNARTKDAFHHIVQANKLQSEGVCVLS